MYDARTLLLVEDNPDDAMILRRALGDLGIPGKMTHVPSAEHALTYLRSPENERPALILLDLHMPGMDGLEFLRTVKSDRALAEIPVVVLTTSQDRQEITQSFASYAAGYIVKPPGYAAAVEALKIIENYWSLNYLPAGRK